MSDGQERLKGAPTFVAPSSGQDFTRWVLLSLILLAAFALRARGLITLIDAAHYDEAYYAVDALSLIDEPRFQPFFDGNFGREGLWMAMLTPALALFGPGAFAIRLTALFTGVLTVAAVARLGREAIGPRGAVYTAAGLSVLYWHVQLSHLGFRALTLPLIGALAFAFLLRAMKRSNGASVKDRSLGDWLIAGIWLGLLAYTYTAARAWLALAGVLLSVMFLRGRRRASAVAALTAGLVAAPLLLYLLTNPAAASQRIDQVALSGIEQVFANIAAWAPVWFSAGPTDIIYNLPGRPLLDPALALLLVGGVLAALMGPSRADAWRRNAGVLGLCLLLVGSALAPALLTTEPLRWLRAIGLVVPVALLIGLAAERLHETLTGIPFRPVWIPALLLTAAGVIALRDLDAWLAHPDLGQPMDRALYQGIDRMSAIAPANAAVVFTPFTMNHPVLRLRETALGDRPVGAFLPEECLIFSKPASYVFAQTAFTPGLRERLDGFATVQPIADDGADPPRWAIWQVTPDVALFDGPWQGFGGLLEASVLDPVAESASAGTTLDLALAFRRVGMLDRTYTAFVHLYDEVDGSIALVAQVDRPICPGSPPINWRADEIAIQPMPLALPADLPPGTYNLAYGIYESPAGVRLPTAEGDVMTLGTLTVN
ncbi:MAG: glycosyltransferase family 39 protein [Chloroflexi bacterium]|nr:glycosyltransferase family 39 protein [Chloroflexota bacterium]